MALATVTTKGQVTIPKKIRDSLKLSTGDKIEFVATGNTEALIRPVSKKVDEVFCNLQKPEQRVASLEEINEAIANRIRSKFQ